MNTKAQSIMGLYHWKRCMAKVMHLTDITNPLEFRHAHFYHTCTLACYLLEENAPSHGGEFLSLV
jgi:hypothetical protein